MYIEQGDEQPLFICKYNAKISQIVSSLQWRTQDLFTNGDG